MKCEHFCDRQSQLLAAIRAHAKHKEKWKSWLTFVEYHMPKRFHFRRDFAVRFCIAFICVVIVLVVLSFIVWTLSKLWLRRITSTSCRGMGICVSFNAITSFLRLDILFSFTRLYFIPTFFFFPISIWFQCVCVYVYFFSVVFCWTFCHKFGNIRNIFSINYACMRVQRSDGCLCLGSRSSSSTRRKFLSLVFSFAFSTWFKPKFDNTNFSCRFPLFISTLFLIGSILSVSSTSFHVFDDDVVASTQKFENSLNYDTRCRLDLRFNCF